MSKFKLMKVFDCYDMPETLRNGFFNLWDNKGNDSTVEWYTQGSIEEKGSISEMVDNWLVENGAIKYEYVLIKYYW